MPAEGFLNQEQKEQLQTAVRKANCPRLREHALILLLQNDGKTYEEIADFIGCGYLGSLLVCAWRRAII